MISHFLKLIIFVSVLTGVIYSQESYLVSKSLEQSRNYTMGEDRSKQSLEIQSKLPNLGFNNLIADWVFLNFVQYFGDENARLKTGYSLVPDYFAVVAKKDPNFVKAFLTLSSANSIYAGLPNKTVDLLNNILRSPSLENVSQSQYLWYYKGVDEMLFLGELDKAKKSFVMAKKWSERVGEKVTAQRSGEIIKFIDTNPDTKQAKVAGWMLILENTNDKMTRLYAIENLRNLGVHLKLNNRGDSILDYPNN